MSVRIEVVDAYGNQTGTVLGQQVVGPAKGYRSLRYHPRGGRLDEAGQCSFDLPMTVRNNFPLAPGAMVRLTDATYGDQGTFVVNEKSESISQDGHWASFTCPDLVEELRWQIVPGFTALANETTAGTLARLMAIQNETHWSASLPANLDGFANVGFTADAATVQQTAAKLLKDRFLHWRLGSGRVLECGTFGTASGIRLVRPSMRPSAMNRPTIRPILAGGLTFKSDLAGVVNCIAPTGAGTGWAQLTLQPLFNAALYYGVENGWQQSAPLGTPFSGYDPNYPVLRRLRLDGGGLDGYQYFLVDRASIATYRQRWLPYPRTDIGTVSNEQADLTAAAAALYQVALAYLKWHSGKHTALDIITDGRGNNVGVAGNTVHVEYREVASGITTIDLHDDYIVTAVERAVDDNTGALTDTWSLSNLGRDVQDDTAIVTGALESIDQIRTAPMIYPTRSSIWVDSPVDASHPLNIPIDLDPAIISTVQAIFTVSLLPVYSTVTSGVVAAHSHTVSIPGHTLNASVPYTSEQPYNPGGQAAYGHTTAANQFSHGHSDTISANKSGTASKTGSATKDGTSNNLNTIPNNGQHGHNVPIFSQGADPTSGKQTLWFNYSSQTIGNNSGSSGNAATGSQTFTSSHGHADTISVNDGIGVSDTIGVSKSGGVSGVGGFQPSVDPHGGFQPSTNFPGYGNDLSYTTTVQTSETVAPAWNPVYGIYNDPTGKASGVTVQVNGAQVAGPFNSDTTVDLTPWITGQTALTVTFTSATLGRLLVRGKIRQRESVYKLGG